MTEIKIMLVLIFLLCIFGFTDINDHFKQIKQHLCVEQE